MNASHKKTTSGQKHDTGRKQRPQAAQMRVEAFSKRAAELADRGTDEPHDKGSAINGTVMKALDQSRSVLEDVVRATQEESFRFANARLRHNAQMFARSRECRDWSDFVILQHDWFVDAARDIADFSRCFGEALEDAAEKSAEGVQKLTREAARSQASAGAERETG